MRGQIGVDVVLSVVGLFLAFAIISSYADRLVSDTEHAVAYITCELVSHNARWNGLLLKDANIIAPTTISIGAGLFSIHTNFSGETNVVWEGGAISCG